MPADDQDPAFSLCPYCRSKVENQATECPDCGGLFPALRHRKGEPLWGAVCGVVRGLFMVGFVATICAVASLLDPPITFLEVLLVVLCVVVTIFLFWLTGRCHERAYHVRL